jgi:hypothetical protein
MLRQWIPQGTLCLSRISDYWIFVFAFDVGRSMFDVGRSSLDTESHTSAAAGLTPETQTKGLFF